MRTPILLIVMLLGLCSPALAQGGAIFRQVVPQPTGKNGYEELVRAVDVLRTSKLLAKAENRQGEGATLAYRRAVLQEKLVQEALRLVRIGLSKAVMSPREAPGTTTLYPEFAGFRRLARLLQIQQYVLLADGRVQEALGVARQGLRLGSVIQTDTLISGLVGLAVNALATSPLSAQLDQLSARDCEALFQLCREWLAQPDPVVRIFEAEQRFGRRALDEMLAEIRKQGAEGLKGVLGEEDDSEEVKRLQAQVPRTPQEIERFRQDTLAQMERFYGQQLAELRKPLWQRQPVEPKADGTLAAGLISALVPTFHQASISYARDQARIRLLACHAAVLRYRWEHDRLPATLAELNLRELTEDPFTGEEVKYEVQGRRYRLYSVGPEGNADDPRTVGGRVPVSVVPGDF